MLAQALQPPSSSDLMGYCDSKWISDYTYSAVLDYLGTPSTLVMSAGDEVQPSLLVWGQIDDEQIRFEPSFQVSTRPRLPSGPGPYSIEARASDGSALFGLSFSPDQIADLPGNRQSFVFAIPMSAATAGRISTLRLTGRGREAVLGAAPPAGSAPVLERVSGGRVRLRWNAQANPMVMVRDADTGEILSLARGGDVEVSTAMNKLELILSDGVRSRVQQVNLP